MSRSDRLLRPFEDGDLSVPTGTVLFLNAHASAVIDLIGREKITAYQNFKPSFDLLDQGGISLCDTVSGQYEMTILTLPRARGEGRGLIAQAWEATALGGIMVISGEKVNGIESILKEMRHAIEITGVTSKSHGKIAWATRTKQTPDLFNGWAKAAAPTKNADGFVTAPGMFSADGIDHGSRRLVEFITPKIKGRVADFGAGWGWLSIAALNAAPAIEVIDLYEADKSALDAARLNLADPRAGFHWTDVTRATGRIPIQNLYNTILMNPPFHVARAADPKIGVAFIAAAKRYLKPSGQLLMVANRHLPYEPALNDAFRRVEKLAEDSQFKIYRGLKPRQK